MAQPKDVVLKLPKAHSKQEPILQSKAKIKVLKCGRQSGKSTVVLILAVQAMLAGKEVGYVCHKFDLSEKFYSLLLKTIPEALIAKKNSSRLQIELVTGGVIQFYSGNETTTLRGNTIHLIICDEFAYWKNPQKSFESDITPVLARHNGDAIILSTPYGKNYFTELYQRSVECEDGYMEGFYFTCYDNPFLSREYLKRQEASMPSQTWKQEYLALESANQNCIVEADVISRNTITQLSTKRPVCIGIDVAKTYDWSSITGIDEDGKMCLHMRFQKDHDSTMNVIKSLPHDIQKVMDSTGAGDVLFEQLQRTVPNLRGFKFTQTTKPQLIKELILSLERNELKFTEQTATELTNFQFKYSSTGYVYYEGKPHDDCVISLALANKFKQSIIKDFGASFGFF